MQLMCMQPKVHRVGISSFVIRVVIGAIGEISIAMPGHHTCGMGGNPFRLLVGSQFALDLPRRSIDF